MLHTFSCFRTRSNPYEKLQHEKTQNKALLYLVAGHGYDEVTDLGLAYKIDAGVTETKKLQAIEMYRPADQLQSMRLSL